VARSAILRQEVAQVLVTQFPYEPLGRLVPHARFPPHRFEDASDPNVEQRRPPPGFGQNLDPERADDLAPAEPRDQIIGHTPAERPDAPSQ